MWPCRSRLLHMFAYRGVRLRTGDSPLEDYQQLLQSFIKLFLKLFMRIYTWGRVNYGQELGLGNVWLVHIFLTFLAAGGFIHTKKHLILIEHTAGIVLNPPCSIKEALMIPPTRNGLK